MSCLCFKPFLKSNKNWIKFWWPSFLNSKSDWFKCVVRTVRIERLWGTTEALWGEIDIGGWVWVDRAGILPEGVVCDEIGFKVIVRVAKRSSHELDSGVIVPRWGPKVIGLGNAVAFEVSKTGSWHKTVLLIRGSIGKLKRFSIFQNSIESIHLRIDN